MVLPTIFDADPGYGVMLSSLNDMSIRSGSKTCLAAKFPIYPLVIQQMEHTHLVPCFFPAINPLFSIIHWGICQPATKMTPGWMLFSYPKPGDSVRILDLLDVTEKIDLNLRHQVWSLIYLYIYKYFISEPGPTGIIATSARRHWGMTSWRTQRTGMCTAWIWFHAKIEGCPKPKTFDWDKTI